MKDMQLYVIFQKNITYCIDPNLCYDNPPKLPADFSVQHDFTVDTSNAVNSSLNYTCRKECMNYLIIQKNMPCLKYNTFSLGV